MTEFNVIDLVAGVAFIAGDMFALLCLFGSAIIFLTGVTSYIQKKQLRFGGQELQWSFMGLVIGIAGQLCLMSSPETQNSGVEGIFRMPVQTVNYLLLLAFSLLLLGYLIRRAAKTRVGYIETPARNKKASRKGLASGTEFNRANMVSHNQPVATRERMKAVTIPKEDMEQEVAWMFSTLYPVTARVDNPPKGKINIKLYDDQNTLIGVVQVSQDPEDKLLPPTVLSTLNSYRSKANVSKAFFVTTGMFRDDTSAQAKEMGISLVDGPLLDAWRKRARVKSEASSSS